MTLITWLYAFIIFPQIAFWLNPKERWMKKLGVSNFISSLLLYLLLSWKISLVFSILLGTCWSVFSSQQDKLFSADIIFTFVGGKGGTMLVYQIGRCDLGELQSNFTISVFQLLFYVFLTGLLKNWILSCLVYL